MKNKILDRWKNKLDYYYDLHAGYKSGQVFMKILKIGMGESSTKASFKVTTLYFL